MLHIISILLLSFFGFSSESKTTIYVKVDGIREVKGNLRLGIYNNSKSFPLPDEQWKGIVKKVEGKSMTIPIELPVDGTFAIAVYHDANGNGKMDKNMLGIPTEVYGFSNNARATFSAPEFSEAQIAVKSYKTQTIKLL